jgi:hypothetical protein
LQRALIADARERLALPVHLDHGAQPGFDDLALQPRLGAGVTQALALRGGRIGVMRPHHAQPLPAIDAPGTLLTASAMTRALAGFTHLSLALGAVASVLPTVALLLQCAFFAWLLVCAPEVVAVLFGPQWTESVVVVQAGAVGGMLWAPCGLAKAVLTLRALRRQLGFATRRLLRAVAPSAGLALAAGVLAAATAWGGRELDAPALLTLLAAAAVVAAATLALALRARHPLGLEVQTQLARRRRGGGGGA